LRSVFNSSSQTFYLIDRDLTILAYNKAAETMIREQYGKTLKLGMKVTDITPNENLIQFRVETERAFSGRKVIVEKYFNVSGQDRWYERHVNPVHNEDGEIDRITMWSLDITDRKKAEKALKENESKFRKLAALLPVGIYQADAYGNTIYINDSLQKIIDMELSAILSGEWTKRIHLDDVKTVKSTWKSVEKNKKTFSLEYRIQSSSGKTVYLLEQAQPLFNHTGEYMGYLGTLIDITEQRLAQRMKQEKQVADNSLKFRSDFLASMSHEIRTPLNGILGMSEILLDTKLNAGQESKIQNILKASKDLKSIVNDVLDLSKLEAGKVVLQNEEFELEELLNLIQERFLSEAKRKGLTMIVDNQIGKAKFNSDRRRITQVLSNLIGNALKFTSKGSITIKVTPCTGSYVKFEVIDTGFGIPLKDSKKLFQDFSQLDHTTAQNLEGTGLGLSISKKLVHLLEGDIGVTSKVNEGSNFWFSLPIEISTGGKPKKEKAKKRTAVKKDLNVLLVEDNLINQQAFKIMLQKMGCKVKVLSNGKQAVENFGKSKYDIVFMDIQMPEMDGLQATAEIKKRFQSVPPVIGLSGNILQRDEKGNLKSDMDDLLMKPVVSQDIERMINKWVA